MPVKNQATDLNPNKIINKMATTNIFDYLSYAFS